jgi:hypothetical protein
MPPFACHGHLALSTVTGMCCHIVELAQQLTWLSTQPSAPLPLPATALWHPPTMTVVCCHIV